MDLPGSLDQSICTIYVPKEVAAEIAFTFEMDESQLKVLAHGVGLDITQDFKGVSFRWMDLRGQDLTGFDFDGADFTGADLRECNITPSSFHHANMAYAVIDEKYRNIEILQKNISTYKNDYLVTSNVIESHSQETIDKILEKICCKS